MYKGIRGIRAQALRSRSFFPFMIVEMSYGEYNSYIHHAHQQQQISPQTLPSTADGTLMSSTADIRSCIVIHWICICSIWWLGMRVRMVCGIMIRGRCRERVLKETVGSGSEIDTQAVYGLSMMAIYDSTIAQVLQMKIDL